MAPILRVVEIVEGVLFCVTHAIFKYKEEDRGPEFQDSDVQLKSCKGVLTDPNINTCTHMYTDHVHTQLHVPKGTRIEIHTYINTHIDNTLTTCSRDPLPCSVTLHCRGSDSRARLSADLWAPQLCILMRLNFIVTASLCVGSRRQVCVGSGSQWPG